MSATDKTSNGSDKEIQKILNDEKDSKGSPKFRYLDDNLGVIARDGEKLYTTTATPNQLDQAWFMSANLIYKAYKEGDDDAMKAWSGMLPCSDYCSLC